MGLTYNKDTVFSKSSYEEDREPVWSSVIAHPKPLYGSLQSSGSPLDKPLHSNGNEGSAVVHPSHYNQGNYEVIDVIDDWKLNFNLGNAIKYIARAGHKNPDKKIEDLKKALFYLEYEIEKLEK